MAGAIFAVFDAERDGNESINNEGWQHHHEDSADPHGRGEGHAKAEVDENNEGYNCISRREIHIESQGRDRLIALGIRMIKANSYYRISAD